MIKPSVMPAGNVVLRSFESEGIHRHSRPVDDYDFLLSVAPTPANTGISFTIPKHLQLLSIFFASNKTIAAATKIQSSILHYEEGGSMQPVTYRNSVVVADISAPSIIHIINLPPFLIVSPGQMVDIFINFDISYLKVWAKEVYVNTLPIYGKKFS